MTMSVRSRVLRAAVAALVVAGLLPAGSSTSTAAPATAATVLPGPAGDKAVRPYMGWSSYSMQVYNPNGGSWITADQLIAQSDAMHAKLQPYGYEYINIDAGWNDGIDEYGRPKPSTKLYPNGLQAVIDHIHANGQKVGLYTIPGISKAVIDAKLPIYNAPGCTTGDLPVLPLQKGDYWGIGYRIDFSKPCAQKYIDSIADLFGSWGLDFLKFDSVTPGSGISDLSVDARDDVKAWSQALKRHNIWLELSWALDINYADTWKQYANGWRIEWDVECYCTGTALTAWPNINRLFPKLAEWWRHAGPGGWNDLDSLDVGNGQMDGLTKDETPDGGHAVGGVRGADVHRQRHDQAGLVRSRTADQPRGDRGQPGRPSGAPAVHEDQPSDVVRAQPGQLVHRCPVQPRSDRRRHDGELRRPRPERRREGA